MYSYRKKIYADDLIEIIQKFRNDILEIHDKLCDDILVNKGLFIMVNSLFEDSIRELMNIILTSFPEKMKLKSTTISKEQICEIADSGYKVIIEKELYLIFREGIVSQLGYLIESICNIKSKDIDNNIQQIIDRCHEISLYRNALVHNGGKITKDLYSKAKFYKPNDKIYIGFDKVIIGKFIYDYKSFFDFIEKEACEKFSCYTKITRIQKLKELWYRCFDSPLLIFENYWEVDIEHDLITGLKKCENENSLSSSEIVYLSIWRHQYYDGFKTKEFLICSINHSILCDIYNIFSDIKFYYMYQESEKLNVENIICGDLFLNDHTT